MVFVAKSVNGVIPIALMQFHMKEIDKNKSTLFYYILFGINYETFNQITLILNAFHKGFRMLISEVLI